MFQIKLQPIGDLTEKGMRQELRQHIPWAAKRAERAAINKTIRNARTEISKRVGQDIALKAKTIKDSIKPRYARRVQRFPMGEITISPKAIPLKEYKPRPRRTGVSVKVLRKNKRKVIEHAFIVKSLGEHVFVRTGKSRLPIKKLFGPSVRKNVEKQRPELEAYIKERFKYNIEDRLRWEIIKLRRKR